MAKLANPTKEPGYLTDYDAYYHNSGAIIRKMNPRPAPRVTASHAELARDPYRYTRLLRDQGPVGWVEALGMWWVVSYREVEEVLRDPGTFVAGTKHSLLYNTFGEHMLTLDGAEQVRQKAPFRSDFAPAAIRKSMEDRVLAIVDALIDTFLAHGKVDLRRAFASRLPILAILELFDIPCSEEQTFRGMYDSFEAALSNFLWDTTIAATAKADVDRFHAVIEKYVDNLSGTVTRSPLSRSKDCDGKNSLTEEELRRNVSIIFFGGISTVEALILNAIYVLGTNSTVRARVEQELVLVPSLIEETLRWMSPVQSATRHVLRPVTLGGVQLNAGDTVNCILAAANRDPDVFPNPDEFQLDRPNVRRHLGFAVGSHFCLGSHLAKLEARIAITRLIERLPEFRLSEPDRVEMEGFEFRQPAALDVCW